jgi:uncharacterized membrane protein YqjE
LEQSTVTLGRLALTSKDFARRLLSTGENRLELLMVEVQEERVRLLRAMLQALGVAAFGLLAGVALSGMIVVLFWDFSPVTVLLALTALYGTVAGRIAGIGVFTRAADWACWSLFWSSSSCSAEFEPGSGTSVFLEGLRQVTSLDQRQAPPGARSVT